MAKCVNIDDRQMNLDFNAVKAHSTSQARKESNVVSFSTYIHSRQLQGKNSSVLDRLLLEAQKIHW